MKNGIDLIDEERCRQISVEGWTAEHDDKYVNCELMRAAQCYEKMADKQIGGLDQMSDPFKGWPWSPEWWKPSENPIRNLEKAGALYRADAERCGRAGMEKHAEEMNAAAHRCGAVIDRLNVKLSESPAGESPKP